MRYYFFLLLIASAIPASAQIFVNKVDVNTRPVQYVEVWEKFNKDNGKFFAMLDYGQQDDLTDRDGKMLYVTNKEGLYLEFNSMVDALNFMFRNGWEVLHVKTIDDIQSYILRQRNDFVHKTPMVSESKNSTTDVNQETKPAVKVVDKVVSNKNVSDKKMVKEIPVDKVKVETPVPEVDVKRVSKTKLDSTKE